MVSFKKKDSFNPDTNDFVKVDGKQRDARKTLGARTVKNHSHGRVTSPGFTELETASKWAGLARS